MSISLILKSIFRKLTGNRQSELYSAGAWVALLTVMVVAASFLPEIAFMTAASMSSAYSKACDEGGYVRIPMDVPGDRVCLPAVMVKRSGLDFFIPTVFAGLVVAGSVLALRAAGLPQD